MSRLLNDLCPHARPVFFEFLARLVEKGIAVIIVDTLRTPEEQAENLSRGVSWTLDSKHLPQHDCGCGLSHAIDVAPFEIYNLSGPDKLRWRGDDPVWQRIIEIGKKLGLRSGENFKRPDKGHFEYIERRTKMGSTGNPPPRPWNADRILDRILELLAELQKEVAKLSKELYGKE